MNIGILGCGNISNAYFGGAKPFSNLNVVACADLDVDRAKAKAAEHGVPKAYSVDEILADPEVELIVNLTIPAVHAPLNKQILEAGKHAYVEKPFGLNLAEAKEVVSLAESKGLRVGCAPDTFLGGGIQTARKALDTLELGKPVSATAFLQCPGHESWHPAPEFYYQKGGGPMLDMGPYYFTALVNLLGPAKRISALTAMPRSQRTITSEPLNGKVMDVEIPTHYSGTVEFVNGALATAVMSFDVIGHHLPPIEVHSLDGSITVPDPNGFDGKVELKKRGEKEWSEVEQTHTGEVGRSFGVADMAAAIAADRPHRASGALATHVLEILLGFERSSESGGVYEMTTTCERPAALPSGLKPGEVD